MGKSNRIRVNRAEHVSLGAVKPKKKQGMPLWLQTTILIVVAALVVSVCAVSILSSNGVFKRYAYPLKSDNYKVSAMMMSYYYQQQVSDFNSNYSSYASYLGIDTSGDLKTQPFSDTAKQILGTSSKSETWHDYFVELATNHAKQVLMLCEEAEARNLTLEADDLIDMNQELLTLESAASMYGYTMDQMVAMQYGDGMKLKDLKAAQELNALATKALYAVQEELADSITDGEIDSKYDSDPDLFDFVDYFYYTENVSYTEVAKEVLGSDYTEAELKASADEVLEAYAKKIADSKAFIEDLLTAKTPEEFQNKYLTKIAEEQYDTKYESITVADDKLPDEETIKAIRAKIIADVVSEIADGKDAVVEPVKNEDNVYKIGDYTVEKEFADAVKTAKVTTFNALLEKNNTFKVEEGTYAQETDMFEWLFAKRAANDVEKFYEGDGADGEVTDENGTFTAYAAIVATPRYRNETPSKIFTYFVFTSEADAKAAIAKFEATDKTLADFKALASEYPTATLDTYEDYTKGAFGLDEFDNWIFADDAKVGDYTKAPISTVTDSTASPEDASYIIAFYQEDGVPSWRIYVKSAIFYEKYEQFYTTLPDKYDVKVREFALKNVG